MITLFKFFFRLYFRLMGWKVQGEIPPGINKAVLAGGGHTSNWDMIFALGGMFTLDRKFSFIIKKEALTFPFKNFLLSLGAIPISRNPNHKDSYVDQLARVFSDRKEFYLCIMPEGTRKPVEKWKSGYYHIAKKANVPVILCYLDYAKKKAVVGKVLSTELSEEDSMAEMKDFFKKISPKCPENFLT